MPIDTRNPAVAYATKTNIVHPGTHEEVLVAEAVAAETLEVETASIAREVGVNDSPSVDATSAHDERPVVTSKRPAKRK